MYIYLYIFSLRFFLDDFTWRFLLLIVARGKMVVNEEDCVTYVCLRCVVFSLSVVSPLGML